MARFHPLKVTEVRKTIRDAVVVSLQTEGTDAFTFTQGQYLTFRREIEGTEIRRSYSICSAPQDGVLQVGIKKVDGGAFSTWANDALSAGMTLDAMEPMGKFHTELDPNQAKTYLCFAGGSGITPILSILKTTLDCEPHSRMTLVYANRGVNTIMFREELEDLKNNYMGRLNIIHILESDAQEIDLFTGRIDEAKCAALFEYWIDIKTVDTAFICGPEPMMISIATALKEYGLNKEQIKFELFASSQPGRLKRKAKSEQTQTQLGEATVIMDGTARSVPLTKDQSVLDAALDGGLDAPFACKAGVCSTCKCKVIKGEVEMVTNHALEDYEVEQGFVLSCQSFALSDDVTVDYDQH
ncbi:1,2-phenylacetyl-CoA epoxidase subunit PaaE [Planktotalea sp.]|uniref:1,2-phenylacetyl-CoA epoxidase subunit PaaE n=1 Tax=Planktotalea sp. TaxID=2029877 RepID=UPI0032997BFE